MWGNLAELVRQLETDFVAEFTPSPQGKKRSLIGATAMGFWDLLLRGRGAGPASRRIQIFPDGVPAHAEIAFDFTDGPALGPIQAMQVMDLFGQEHGVTLFIRRKANGCQNNARQLTSKSTSITLANISDRL